jgi:hypothetical protein
MLTKTKPKMGRPKLPKNQAKGVLYAVRVSPADATRIEDAITRSGLPKPEWHRKALLNTALEP